MDCVITGASGFLGRRIAQRLQMEGHKIHPMALCGEKIDLENPFFGDISKSDGFEFPKTDVLVHCAGLLESGHHPEKLMMKVNFEGTKNVLREALAKGCRKMVYISTISAVGPKGSPEHPITEATVPGPEDAYGRSKLMSERFLKEESGKGGPDIVILRPSVLYGPGMNVNSSAFRIFESVRKGRMPLVRGGRTTLNMLYVDNLVDAVVSSIYSKVRFAIYNVADGPYTQKQVIDTISKRMGKEKGFLRMPVLFLWSATLLSSMISPFLKGPPPLSWTKYRALTSDVWRMDQSLITRELSYAPRTTLEKGVDITCSYYGW